MINKYTDAIESTFSYSAYAAWMRNLERVLFASGTVTDAGLELLEFRGLSFCFDAKDTTPYDEEALREHDPSPIRGGLVDERGGADYLELLNAPRVGLSLQDAIDKMQFDPQTKSAVLQLCVEESSKPCLSTLDFKLREGRLELTAFFRSQDVWRRQPANLLFLIECSRLVAASLGVESGLIRVLVASAHIYSIDAEEAIKHVFTRVETYPKMRPVAVAVVGREKAHGDLIHKPWAYEWAYAVGAGLAARGFVLVTGGLGGIMESACRGTASAGGINVGIVPLIPESEALKRRPNPYQTLVLRTGLDQRERIPIIVNSSDAMVVINGGGGTRIEAELALEQGKPVIALQNSGGVADELLQSKKNPRLISAENAREVVMYCTQLWPMARAVNKSI